MSRADWSLAPIGVHDRSQRAHLMVAACTIVASALTVAAIVRSMAPPQDDQANLLYMSLHAWPPSFDGGVSARLLARIAGWLVSTDPVVHNTVLRSLSAVLCLTGVSAALWATGVSVRIWLLCFTVFLGSGQVLLWSADVLVIAGIAWLAYTAWTHGHVLALVPAGWLLTFAKPDLFVPGLALSVGAVVSVRQREQVRDGLIVMAAIAVTFLLALGATEAGDRATFSFGQHYARLMHPAADGFAEWERILTADFGRVVTVDEVITAHPAVYLAFVWRSFCFSLNVISKRGLWPLLALGIWGAWRTRSEPFTISAAIFTLISAALITLFAFLHYRYAGRFIVLALLLIARALAQSRDRPFRLAAFTALTLTFLWQSVWWPSAFWNGEFLPD